MMKPIAVFTTVASIDEARTMARSLVERRLAACVQISEIESWYRWKQAVQQDKEFRLLVKTTDAHYAAVEQAIRELHSYELPAIHSVAFDNVYAPYGDWIDENASGCLS